MSEVIVINPTKQIIPGKELLKVCAYVRVSSDSDDQENSFLTQFDYYNNLIANNPDWRFVDIYADNGITGTELEHRDEFNRMCKDCKDGKIDLILVKSVSRFARNTYDCINMVRKLKLYGTDIVFEKENIDTRKMNGEMELAALSCIAQEESMSLSKNLKMGIKYRMQNGTYKQGSVPFGYMLNENGEWIIVEEQAKVVRLVFNAYINGSSLAKIARELSEAEIMKNNGYTKWDPRSLGYIIRNVRYKGDTLLQKTYTEDFPFKTRKNKGERDMYYVKRSNEPIVTEEIFEKANKLLREQSSRYYTNSKRKMYPLSRMIFCRECNSMFRRKITEEKTVWICRTKNKNSSRCQTPQVMETAIYNGFVNIYNRLENNMEIILTPLLNQLGEYKKTRLRVNCELENINKELADLTEQILVLGKMNAQGYIESALYMEKSNELTSRIAKLKKDKKIILGNDECEEIYKKTEMIINFIKEIGPIGEFDEKIFKKIINKIYVNKDRLLTYELVNGLELKIEYEEVKENGKSDNSVRV